MASILARTRPALGVQRLRLSAPTLPSPVRRALTTLPSNAHIFVHEVVDCPYRQYLLSLLPNEPPIASLAIGTTSEMPPTSHPASLRENPDFLRVLHHVIAEHAVQDPDVQAQAAVYASQAGAALGAGGRGGAGRGGYIHVSDQRHPPDFGRVAWPEDILGSLEIDGAGRFVDGTGRYQRSGTYRIATHDGVLGLSTHLRQKLVETLRELDAQARKSSR